MSDDDERDDDDPCLDDDDESAEGECPFCDPADEHEDNCEHYVTAIDRTFPHPLGLCRAAVEPEEPLGCEGVGGLATAIFDLLEHFLTRDPKWKPSEVKKALKFPPKLLALVLAEYEGSELYGEGEYAEVSNDTYSAFAEWKDYVDDAITRSSDSVECTSHLAGGPMMSSSYNAYWASDGEGVADGANGCFYEDQERVKDALKSLTESSA